MADVIADALLLTVNYAEVIGALVRRGLAPDDARAVLARLAIEIIDLDRPLAGSVGVLVARTRDRGLSFGDCACLALAARESAPAITADRAWDQLNLGIAVQLIR